VALLSLSGCYGICKPYCKKDPYRDKPVFVTKAEVKEDEDKGWYEVTDGWMSDRMEYEQGLQEIIKDLRARYEALKEVSEP